MDDRALKRTAQKRIFGRAVYGKVRHEISVLGKLTGEIPRMRFCVSIPKTTVLNEFADESRFC